MTKPFLSIAELQMMKDRQMTAFKLPISFNRRQNSLLQLLLYQKAIIFPNNICIFCHLFWHLIDKNVQKFLELFSIHVMVILVILFNFGQAQLTAHTQTLCCLCSDLKMSCDCIELTLWIWNINNQ